MGPKKLAKMPQEDLFRLRLENMISMEHELVKLSRLIRWGVFEEEWGKLFESNRGAPAIPTRLIAGLHYLKHMYKLSDEDVVERWVENPYWQYFCGEQWFRHDLPIDPSSMSRWRKRIGRDGCELLLKQTIETATDSGSLPKKEFRKVNVDTTVQEKNIAFPTDAKLLDAARRKLVKLAGEHGIGLRQNYNRVGKRLVRQIGGYTHARQFRRMRSALKKLNIRVGRVVRDIERQLMYCDDEVREAFTTALSQAKRIMAQKRSDKHKLYSLHAPETECISKGKAHKRYEFGVKVSLATTSASGFVVGARSCPGNPYDGHTLAAQVQQVEALTGTMPNRCFVDRGYRGHGVAETRVFISGQRRGVTRTIKKELRRRSAIEPEIGHMKNDGYLGRCYLKGVEGDAMNVILCASGHNLRKILNWLMFFARFVRGSLMRILKGWFAAFFLAGYRLVKAV
ncbi:MAG: IS5 family transposase [Mariprofundaceae bacterium]|nr:IS5 family transposase [Mariprofundaceae bacterium]